MTLFSRETFPLWAVLAFGFLRLIDGPAWRSFLARLGPKLLAGACVFVLLFFAACAAAYGLSNVLVDHAEPNVMAVAWAWKSGGAVYHALDAPERYTQAYGPGLYLVNAASLALLGPDIPAGKAPGVFFALAGLAVVLLTIRRETRQARGNGWLIPLVGAAYVAACLGFFRAIPYWVRPDPPLVFWSALGLAASLSRRRMPAALGCGLAIGASLNLKVTAGLYFLPALALLFRRHRRGGLLACAAWAAAFLALPYFAQGVSFGGYLAWLRVAGARGIDWDAADNVLRTALFLCAAPAAALVALAWADRERFGRFVHANALFLAACGSCAVLILGPASMVGAGPYHLLPFLPVLALGLAKTLARLRGTEIRVAWRRQAVAAAAGAFALTAGVIFLAEQRQVLALERQQGGAIDAALAEIADVADRYPGRSIAMGYGDDATYPLTWCRPALPFRAQPYRLDAAAVMDFQQGGRPLPAATLDALDRGQTALWLVPRGGEPFSLHSFYPSRRPVFDPPMRNRFLSRYQIGDRTAHFDVWMYRPLAGDVSALSDERGE